jgi:hypothetical protein
MDGWELVNRNDKKSYEATEPGSIIVSPMLGILMYIAFDTMLLLFAAIRLSM